MGETALLTAAARSETAENGIGFRRMWSALSGCDVDSLEPDSLVVKPCRYRLLVLFH